MTEQKITKVFILAGGMGTRLSEQTKSIPKPLVSVAGEPIILHVMRTFYCQGVREFYLLCGYKVNAFKHFFKDYMNSGNNMLYTKYGSQAIDDSSTVEDWRVHVIDTGEEATTGQRVDAIRKYVADGEPFFLTYGDSVSDLNPLEVSQAHFNNSSSPLVTITAVNLSERFGVLSVDEKSGLVNKFAEKSDNATQLINGGFMACSHSLLDEVNSKTGDLSFEVLTKLAGEGRMGYFKHNGFWHAMDTQRDLDTLNRLKSENPTLF